MILNDSLKNKLKMNLEYEEKQIEYFFDCCHLFFSYLIA